MKEFKGSYFVVRLGVMLIIFLALVAMLTYIILKYEFFDGDFSSLMPYFISIVSGVFFILFIAILVVSKRKFQIEDDRFKSNGVFGSRELLFQDVKEFEFKTSNTKFGLIGYIKIIPIEPHKDIIYVYASLEGFREIRKLLLAKFPAFIPESVALQINKSEDTNTWAVAQYFTDLDERTKEVAFALSQDTTNMCTLEECETKVKRVFLVTQIANLLTAFPIFILYFPFRNIGMFFILGMEILFLLIMLRYRRLICLNLDFTDKESKSPNMFFGMAGLLFWILIDIFSASNYYISYISLIQLPFWLIVIALSALHFGVIYVLSAKINIRKDLVNVIAIWCLLLINSFFLGIFYNSYFDTSTPQSYNSAVCNKYITTKHSKSGTSYHYYLTLSSLAGVKGDGIDISVSESEYETVNIGDSVTEKIHQGKLNIAWYQVVLPE